MPGQTSMKQVYHHRKWPRSYFKKLELPVCQELTSDEVERLASRSDLLTERFISLMRTAEFERAVSQGTGDKSKVVLRFSEIDRIIKETLR